MYDRLVNIDQCGIRCFCLVRPRKILLLNDLWNERDLVFLQFFLFLYFCCFNNDEEFILLQWFDLVVYGPYFVFH